MRVLANLERGNMLKLAHICKSCPSHIPKVANELARVGIITKEREGRDAILEITPHAKHIKEACETIESYMKSHNINKLWEKDERRY
jgi:predicted transcriptional regulator